MSKKKEFFIKQGYSEEMINYLEGLGVKTHMIFFLVNLKRLESAKRDVYNEAYKKLIVLVNDFFKKEGKNKFKNFEDAAIFAVRDKEIENRIKKNTIHKFSDGHYIVKLTHLDLEREANKMSNCVANYYDKVKENRSSILALKNKKGETLVHFEIQRNGVISQNYEKANLNVRGKNWKYINEFLTLNSKNIDVKNNNFFDFSWNLNYNKKNGFLSVSSVMPTSIIQEINRNGEKVNKVNDFCIIKKFNYLSPFREDVEFNSFNKLDVINKLEEIKSSINNVIDDLIKETEITEGKNLYISDELKEKLFGKDNFILKGDKYSFQDLLMDTYGENRIDRREFEENAQIVHEEERRFERENQVERENQEEGIMEVQNNEADREENRVARLRPIRTRDELRNQNENNEDNNNNDGQLNEEPGDGSNEVLGEAPELQTLAFGRVFENLQELIQRRAETININIQNTKLWEEPKEINEFNPEILIEKAFPKENQ